MERGSEEVWVNHSVKGRKREVMLVKMRGNIRHNLKKKKRETYTEESFCVNEREK